MYIVDPQGQHRNVDWFNHGKRGKADLCSGKEEKKRSERLDPTRKTLFYMQLTHSPHPTIILAHFLPFSSQRYCLPRNRCMIKYSPMHMCALLLLAYTCEHGI